MNNFKVQLMINEMQCKKEPQKKSLVFKLHLMNDSIFSLLIIYEAAKSLYWVMKSLFLMQNRMS